MKTKNKYKYIFIRYCSIWVVLSIIILCLNVLTKLGYFGDIIKQIYPFVSILYIVIIYNLYVHGVLKYLKTNQKDIWSDMRNASPLYGGIKNDFKFIGFIFNNIDYNDKTINKMKREGAILILMLAIIFLSIPVIIVALS